MDNSLTPAVKLVNVSKKLGNQQILQNVNLLVSPGEVVGIVGSNGSGKTTLLRLITGLLYSDTGEVVVHGKKVSPGMLGDLPTSIGVLIETPGFLPSFSGYRNLKMLAGIRDEVNSEQIRKTLEQVGLDPENKKPVRTYSLGMRQRLGIAQAIMESPALLLFDEPTNALDKQGVEMFSCIVQERIRKNASVILVSHVKEEIDRFCNRVYRIENGQVSILREKRELQWKIIVNCMEDLEKISHVVPSIQMGSRVNGYPTGLCRGDWTDKNELLSILTATGAQVIDIEEQTQS